jgi:carboxyl-terminal processing protease
MPNPARLFVYGLLTGAGVTGLGFLIAQSFLGPLLDRSFLTQEEQVLSSVHRYLTEDYVELRDSQALLQAGVIGMVKTLQDPYTQWIGPDGLQQFEETTSGERVGIGVQMNEDGRVYFPYPDSPAAQAGILPGDLLLEVDGQADGYLGVFGRFWPALKGKSGTFVSLDFQRPDKTKYNVNIKRQPLSSSTVGKVTLLDIEKGIGLLHIRSFAKSTPRELDTALAALKAKGLKALVLDLRFNTGGLLDTAVAVTGRFIRGGVVCTLKGRNVDRRVRKADPSVFFGEELPLVVLINRYSASGSEVLASCLRDRGAAILVGERSFGKGVFQKVQQYPDKKGILKFTAGYFLSPQGKILEGHIQSDFPGGLEPDVHTASPLDLIALRSWLRTDLPPLQYRAAIQKYFPNRPLSEPPHDPALLHSIQLLQKSLQEIT